VGSRDRIGQGLCRAKNCTVQFISKAVFNVFGEGNIKRVKIYFGCMFQVQKFSGPSLGRISSFLWE
jgi:hypothetical protein